MIQWIIFISACGAIGLISTKTRFAKWGYLIGFVGQPFWIYDSMKRNQWGIFLVALWFAGCYGYGVYAHILNDSTKGADNENSAQYNP